MRIPIIAEPKDYLSNAILVPSPPKSASQTLAELVSASSGFPIIKPKSHRGLGHLVIQIPPISKLEKIRRIASPRAGRPSSIIYGHFPASRHNLKQLYQRYSIHSCVMPVRPIGATLCSLINYTRVHKGPLDPEILELTEGFAGFHRLDISEAFFLFALRYLAPMHTIIEGWARTCIAKDIRLITLPFKSIIDRQPETNRLLSTMAGLDPERIQAGYPQKPIKVNLSQGARVGLSDIDESIREEVLRMATAMFRSDTNLEPLRSIFSYLVSDLSRDSDLNQSPDVPLAWNVA